MKSFQIPQKGDPDCKQQSLPFPSIPTVHLLSSDEEELKPVPLVSRHSSQLYTPVLELVKRPESQTYVRGKMTEIILEAYEKIKRQTQAEKAEVARNPIVRKTDPKLLEQIERLKKEFPTHSYLPVECLRELHAEFKKVPIQCVVERQKYDPIFNERQRMRQKLTWAFRLALEELKYKVKPEEYTQFEKELVSANTDSLQVSFRLASEIEVAIYKKKFLESQRTSAHPYNDQMVLVSSQLKDALNIEFHRQVLNRNYDLKKLAKISENDLMSAEAKEVQRKKLEQFVREHEVQHRPLPVVEEPIITYGGEMPRHYQQRLEEEERERMKMKKEEKPVIPMSVIQLEKTKKIAKKAYRVYVKNLQTIAKRVEKLKESNLNHTLVRNISDFPPNLYPSS